MKKYIVILFIFLNSLVLAQQNTFKWEGKIKSVDEVAVQYAPVQIETQEQYYMFMSDEAGEISINYEGYTDTDTLTIACLGYKIKKMSCSSLIQKEYIKLEKDFYEINEVIVNPIDIEFVKIGNLNNTTKRSLQIGFNNLAALYIPNNGVNGKINSVRIFMHDFYEKDWKYRPFRLKLFEGNEVVGKEIIQKEIIVFLKPNEKHWVEIDLTLLDVDFPEEGVFVVVQALPYEYYKKNGYIKSRTIKKGKLEVPNSISIGWSKKNKSDTKIQSWYSFNDKSGWSNELLSNIYFMMQILVEPYSRRY